MEFTVMILGVGDAFSERHHPACLLLICDDFYLSIDCPDRYRAVLSEASSRSGRQVGLDQINDFVITHVHGDHMNGLEGVGFFKHFVEKRKVRVYTISDVRASIWDSRLKGSMSTLWDGQKYNRMGFDDFFDYYPLGQNDADRVGPFRVRTYLTGHHVPTFGMLIEAGGKRLGYSGDTAFDPGLIEFLDPADLIIHETNLGPAHTDIHLLTGLPVETQAKIRLIHYPDDIELPPCHLSLLREGEMLRL